MKAAPNNSPSIYHFPFVRSGHQALSPERRIAAQKKLEDKLDAAGPSRFESSWMQGKRQANKACAAVFSGTSHVFGNASSERHGLTGMVAHSVAGLLAAVLTAPSLIGCNMKASGDAYNSCRQVILYPMTPVCMLSASAGLLFKGALGALLYPLVTVGGFVGHVFRTPKAGSKYQPLTAAQSPAGPPAQPNKKAAEPEAIAMNDVAHLREKHIKLGSEASHVAKAVAPAQ